MKAVRHEGHLRDGTRPKSIRSAAFRQLLWRDGLGLRPSAVIKTRLLPADRIRAEACLLVDMQRGEALLLRGKEYRVNGMAAPALRTDPLHIERRAAHGKEAVVAVPRVISWPEDLNGEDIRAGQQDLL